MMQMIFIYGIGIRDQQQGLYAPVLIALNGAEETEEDKRLVRCCAGLSLGSKRRRRTVMEHLGDIET